MRMLRLLPLLCFAAVASGCTGDREGWYPTPNVRSGAASPSASRNSDVLTHNPRCDDPPLNAARAAPIPEILRWLQAARLRRKEFETSAEHSARTGPALAAIQSRLEQRQGTTLIMLQRRLPETFVRYNADNQRFNFATPGLGFDFVRTQTVRTPQATAYRTITNDPNIVWTGSYVGSNAFGATRTVHSGERESWGLAFDPGASLTGSWPVHGYQISVPVPREAAPATKNNLALMIAGDLTAPYYVDHDFYRGPTLDHPTELMSLSRLVVVQFRCAAIIDRRNGKILQFLVF